MQLECKRPHVGVRTQGERADVSWLSFNARTSIAMWMPIAKRPGSSSYIVPGPSDKQSSGPPRNQEEIMLTMLYEVILYVISKTKDECFVN